MDLTIVLETLGIVALLAFIFISLKLVKALNSATSLMNETEKSVSKLSVDLVASMNRINADISEIKSKVVESLSQVDRTLASAETVVRKVDSQVDSIRTIFDPFKQLSERFYDAVAAPVNKTIIVVSAITKAIDTVTSFFGQRKR